MHRLYATATVMEVPCLTVGSVLPQWWQTSANGVGRDKRKRTYSDGQSSFHPYSADNKALFFR
jgi:hypothetical protein